MWEGSAPHAVRTSAGAAALTRMQAAHTAGVCLVLFVPAWRVVRALQYACVLSTQRGGVCWSNVHVRIGVDASSFGLLSVWRHTHGVRLMLQHSCVLCRCVLPVSLLLLHGCWH